MKPHTHSADPRQRARVLVVDDHAAVRAGVVSLLAADSELEVVGAAADGAEAVELAQALCPDIVVMDLSLPVLDGIEATRQITTSCRRTRVLVLTSFADRLRLERARSAGAVGYVLKDSEPGELLARVRRLAFEVA